VRKTRGEEAILLSPEWVGKTDKMLPLHKTVIVSACLGGFVVKQELISSET
jgi:hypothetical protein